MHAPPVAKRSAGLSKDQRLFQQSSLVVQDIAALSISLIIVLYANDLTTSHATFPYIQITPFAFATIALITGVYDREMLVKFELAFIRCMRALVHTGFVLLALLFALQNTGGVSRLTLTGGFILATVWMLAIRYAVVASNKGRTGPYSERTLIIEDGCAGPKGPYFHYHAFDAVDIIDAGNDPAALQELGKVIRKMDRVVVACTPDKRTAWAEILRSIDAQAELLDEAATQLGVIGVSSILSDCTLIVSAHPLNARQRATKRLFDLVLASLALIVVLPLLIFTALAIFLEDGAPILFRQARVGQANRTFRIYKFRSMSADRSDHDAAVLTRRGDDRVTRVGRIIRATSIDELPQLLNVLRGQMSIVGPRPHAALAKAGSRHYFQVDGRYWQRHRLKPGLTGLAQVRGFRGATDHEDHLRDRLGADLEYLANWSIWRDLRIVVATLRVLVHPQAY